MLLEESRTQFKVDPTQTLRKIDIVNRDKQPKAPLKKSVAESKL